MDTHPDIFWYVMHTSRQEEAALRHALLLDPDGRKRQASPRKRLLLASGSWLVRLGTALQGWAGHDYQLPQTQEGY